MLAGNRKELGHRHLRTLASANNLAQLLMARERLEEAEPLVREALTGYRAMKDYAMQHSRGLRHEEPPSSGRTPIRACCSR